MRQGVLGQSLGIRGRLSEPASAYKSVLEPSLVSASVCKLGDDDRFCVLYEISTVTRVRSYSNFQVQVSRSSLPRVVFSLQQPVTAALHFGRQGMHTQS